MVAQKIEQEIKRTEEHLSFLKSKLQKIQENCEHQFTYDENFGRCVKCHKTDALYY
ncbi:MAG TPA: serine protease [Bacillota bacterium]